MSYNEMNSNQITSDATKTSFKIQNQDQGLGLH